MTQEQKELLLKDLCSRLLYRPKGLKFYKSGACLPDNITIIGFSGRFVDVFEAIGQVEVEEVRLYLRPLSSMTDEEKNELLQLMGRGTDIERVDFYISHHFDYRCLIPMGLALEAPKDMYKI